MPMVWTEAAVAKLFLGVLATSEVKIDHKALAEYMGPECTAEAIKQKMRRMKAAEKNEDVGNTLAAGTPATNGKAGKTPKDKSTAKRKEMSDDEIFEGEDLDPTPSKPAKTSKPAKKSKVGAKSAAGDEEGVNSVKKKNGVGLGVGKMEDGEAV